MYYGKHPKTLKDYYDAIQAKFPKIPATDLHKILNFGWKSLYLINSYGGDVLIKDSGFWFYIGELRTDSLAHFEYYKKKLRNKIRVMYNRKKIPWDGYYYFGLSEERYAEYINSKKRRGRLTEMIADHETEFDYNRRYILQPVTVDPGDGTISPDMSYDLYGHIVHWNSVDSQWYDSSKNTKR